MMVVGIFKEIWEDGALLRIDQAARQFVEMDEDFLNDMPEEQFIFTMVEIVSQLFGRVHGPEDLDKYRKQISDAIDSMTAVQMIE